MSDKELKALKAEVCKAAKALPAKQSARDHALDRYRKAEAALEVARAMLVGTQANLIEAMLPPK